MSLNESGRNSQDNSDGQYRSFRNNLIPLTFLASVFFFLSYIYNRATRSASSIPPSSLAPPNRLRRIPFLFLFSLTMIIFLHGFSALKVIFILLVNFFIAKFTCSSASPTYLGPFLTWAFNGIVLYSNETHGGYKFSQLHPSLDMLVRPYDGGASVLFDPYEGRSHGCDLFALARTTSMDSILAGTSHSTSPCCVSCLSIWITTGPRVLHIDLSRHVFSPYTLSEL
jgi:hypothetical protein